MEVELRRGATPRASYDDDGGGDDDRDEKDDANRMVAGKDMCSSRSGRRTSSVQIQRTTIAFEAISANGARLLLLITYSAFIGAVMLEVYNAWTRERILAVGALDCNGDDGDGLAPVLGEHDSVGCTTARGWSGYVNDVRDLQGTFTFVVGFPNDTTGLRDMNYSNIDEFADENSDQLLYSIKIQGCKRRFDCSPADAYDVLRMTNHTTGLHLRELDVTAVGGEDTRIWQYVLATTFQNQESVAGKARVKSYYIEIKYLHDPGGLLTGDTTVSDVEYYFQYDHATISHTKAGIQLGFFAVTLTAFIIWLDWLRKDQPRVRLWMRERKLIAIFTLGVLFYQNPYLIALFFLDRIPPGQAFAAETVTILGETLLFFVWIALIDALRHRPCSQLHFYFPKVAITVCLLGTAFTSAFLSFPSLYSERSPFLSVRDWNERLRWSFTVMVSAWAFLLLVWSAWFIVVTALTARELQRSNYMETRDRQLAFRFFALLALLIGTVYVLEYVAILARTANTADKLSSNVGDNLATILRNQSQIFAKCIMLTAAALTFLYVYLPPNAASSQLSVKYAVWEEDARMWKREHAGRREVPRAQDVFLQVLLATTGNDVSAPTYVFCVETALRLLELSWQAYLNPEPGVSVPGSYGTMDKSAMPDMEMIDYVNVEETGMHVIVMRHRKQNFLCVAIRGSATAQNWKANLQHTLEPLDLNAWHTRLLAINALDGLGEYTPAEEAEEQNEVEVLLGHAFDMHNLPGVTSRDDEFFWDSDSEDEMDDNEDEIYNHDGDGDGDGDGQKLAFFHRLSSHLRPSTGEVREGIEEGEESGAKVRREAGAGRPSMGQVAATAGAATLAPLHGAIQNITAGLHQGAGVAGHYLEQAAHTTGLSRLPLIRFATNVYVHQGFLSSYNSVRERVHEIVRKALRDRPGHVYCTGHSMGGAVATLAAFDLSLFTLPRVRRWFRHQIRVLRDERRHPSGDQDRPSFADHVHTLLSNGGRIRRPRMSVVTFGSPRVGNHLFAANFNRVVPDCWRCVADGDLVTAAPPKYGSFGAYKHVGTEVVTDAAGRGMILINPSWIERWSRTTAKRKVASHLLGVYRKGLEGVRAFAEPLWMDVPQSAAASGAAGPAASVGVLHSDVARTLLMRESSFSADSAAAAAAAPDVDPAVEMYDDTDVHSTDTQRLSAARRSQRLKQHLERRGTEVMPTTDFWDRALGESSDAAATATATAAPTRSAEGAVGPETTSPLAATSASKSLPRPPASNGALARMSSDADQFADFVSAHQADMQRTLEWTSEASKHTLLSPITRAISKTVSGRFRTLSFPSSRDDVNGPDNVHGADGDESGIHAAEGGRAHSASQPTPPVPPP